MRIGKSTRLTKADMFCIENALQYIDKHYTDRISAEQLSMEVSLSKEKLQAGLRKRTGYTLHEYLLQVRIEKAKELLSNTNHPVKAVADAAGFNNDSHFCKVFRKFAATSPVQYRLQQAV